MKHYFYSILFSATVLAACASSTNKQDFASNLQNEKKAPIHQGLPICEHTETSFRCVKVQEVYDGDTIFIDLPDQHPLFGRRIGVRIFGIDTPEKKPMNLCEKKKAVVAQAALQKLINEGHSVDIVNVRRDKFFRILGEVLVDGRSVADELLRLKLAYPYHGEKKIKRNWCL